MDAVVQLEHYLSKNTIDSFIKEMMVSCLKEKPEEPMQFLLKFILQKNAGKASEEVAVASTSAAVSNIQGAAQPSEAFTHLAIAHSDRKVQQYLTDKKVHIILLELLKQVIEEQPDNALSFIALQAHNLHKAPPASLDFQ